MNGRVEAIEEPGLVAQLRAQARRVHLGALAAALAGTALGLLL